MIGKIMPHNRLGTFYGTQSAAANLLGSLGSVLAGIILLRVDSPADFALCFFISGVAMTGSWVFIWRTREPENPPVIIPAPIQPNLWRSAQRILAADRNYRWFLGARILVQCAAMSVGFLTIYAVRQHGMDEQTAGVMAGLLLIGQTIASPILGWAGDHWGHRRVFVFGALLLVLTATLAIIAPQLSWFYVIFLLTGFANAVLWTTTMSITVEFGSEVERPFYIGMTNTLVAPATLLAPIIGGWLVDIISFHAMFLASALLGLVSVIVLQLVVADPRRAREQRAISAAIAPAPVE
jgi:MFS family permease